MIVKRVLLAFSLSIALASLAFAQVKVEDPWVRATVPQQRATGLFMQLTAPAEARLIEVQSPAAGVVEIHAMTMDNDVMRMRAIEGLDLPAGQTVALKPGGYHVMLIDLKEQAQEGMEIPVTLIVENKNGQRETIEIAAPVRPLNPARKQHGHTH